IDADCAPGYSCAQRTGVCVFGATCDGDHTMVVTNGPPIDCTPYRCAGVACLQKCVSSSDCVAGTTCSTSSGACEVSAAADSGGGCSFAPAGGHIEALASLGLLGLLTLVRRRR